MANERVLLVDDEKDFLDTLKERLEVRELQVSIATDGKEALRIIEKQSFDAVVLDVNMPGLDGIETLRRIVERDPDAQVILLTGHATARQGAEAMRLGAVDLLEKPADLPDLLRKIGDAAAKRLTLIEEHSADRIADLLKSKGW